MCGELAGGLDERLAVKTGSRAVNELILAETGLGTRIEARWEAAAETNRNMTFSVPAICPRELAAA